MGLIVAPALHIHRPRTVGAIGGCPVCDRPLGLEPALVGDGKRSEWICASCLSAIEAALARWRVRAFIAGGSRA